MTPQQSAACKEQRQRFSVPNESPNRDLTWLQSVSASLPEVVIACDLSGTIRYESGRAAHARAAGTLPPLPVLLKKCLPEASERSGTSATLPDLVHLVLRALGREAGCSGYLFLSAEGQLVPSEVSAHPLSDDAGRSLGLLLRIQTPVPSWKAMQKLRHEASHDALTGLLNRREFFARLNRLIEQRGPHDQHSLLMMDLDSFKQVNDVCGHNAGDDALRHIATLLRSKVRCRDALARFGGDEFCLLIEHCSAEKAAHAARKLVNAVESFAFVWSDRAFRFGLSVGVVALSERHADCRSVLAEADAACYRVKKRGGHDVAVVEA